MCTSYLTFAPLVPSLHPIEDVIAERADCWHQGEDDHGQEDEHGSCGTWTPMVSLVSIVSSGVGRVAQVPWKYQLGGAELHGLYYLFRSCLRRLLLSCDA